MDVVQPVAAIFLVLALLSGALLTLKKRGVVSRNIVAGHRLEVVERITLGPHHALHLVRTGGRLLLVATAPNSCQLLDHTVTGKEDA
ncbi:MAG TPA: flagellar biosynthetic protein FliO [Bryobacteraceae bacterium]|jgi:flagellar biogenesis protein FliO|nr:flagellar biosynthetic protein FliO [Bryobacteraceae bacterium]